MENEQFLGFYRGTGDWRDNSVALDAVDKGKHLQRNVNQVQ